MDSILADLRGSSIKERLNGVAQLHDFLSASNTIPFDSIDDLITALSSCISDNNFRVSSGSLDCLTLLLDVSSCTSSVSQHLSTILPNVVNRLSDAKQAVRDSAVSFLSSSLQIQSPQSLWERLAPVATISNAKAKESLVAICSEVSSSGGWGSLNDEVVKTVSSLSNDRDPGVRSRASQFISDLGSSTTTSSNQNTLASTKNQSNRPESSKPSSSLPSPTALFEITPVQPPNDANIEKQFSKYGAVIGDKNADWNQRCEKLRQIYAWFYSYLKTNSTPSHTFLKAFKDFIPAFKLALGDLRSSLVKEACQLVSIASITLRENFEVFFEPILPVLLKMTFVTVAIIASAGDQAVRSALLHSPINQRILTILCEGVSSRHNQLRAKSAKYLGLILSIHSPPSLAKFEDILCSAIGSSLSDALPECRAAARVNIWLLERHFPGIADDLLSTAEPHQRKAAIQEREVHVGEKRGHALVKYVYNLFLPSSDIKIAIIGPHLGLNDYSIPANGGISVGVSSLSVNPRPSLASTVKNLPPSTAVPVEDRLTQSLGSNFNPNINSNISNNSSVGNTISSSFNSNIGPNISQNNNQPVNAGQNLRRLSRFFGSQSQSNEVKESRQSSIVIDENVIEIPESREFSSPSLSPSPLKSTLPPLTPKTPGYSLSNKNYAMSPMVVKETDVGVLTALISKLRESLEDKRLALSHLVSLLRTSLKEHVWASCFSQLLLSLMNLLEDYDSTVRELALFVIREIAKNETISHLLCDFSEILLLKTVSLVGDEILEVSDAADDCAEELLSALDPQVCFPLLIPIVVSAENVSVKTSAIRLSGLCLAQIGPLVLSRFYSETSLLISTLKSELNSTELSLRKTIVFCFVDVYLCLKDQLGPFLHGLSPTHLKLVSVYILKECASRQEECVLPELVNASSGLR
ncbi:hypothetical protein RCL1_003258 [Eukaryota sp. TZLM3-RCL]